MVGLIILATAHLFHRSCRSSRPFADDPLPCCSTCNGFRAAWASSSGLGGDFEQLQLIPLLVDHNARLLRLAPFYSTTYCCRPSGWGWTLLNPMPLPYFGLSLVVLRTGRRIPSRLSSSPSPSSPCSASAAIWWIIPHRLAVCGVKTKGRERARRIHWQSTPPHCSSFWT